MAYIRTYTHWQWQDCSKSALEKKSQQSWALGQIQLSWRCWDGAVGVNEIWTRKTLQDHWPHLYVLVVCVCVSEACSLVRVSPLNPVYTKRRTSKVQKCHRLFTTTLHEVFMKILFFFSDICLLQEPSRTDVHHGPEHCGNIFRMLW